MEKWRDALKEFPPDGLQVLCVKELKNGRRTMCFGTHWNDVVYDRGWVTGGGNNNVILWSFLPEMPEGTVEEITRKKDKVPADLLRDAVNFMCYMCGKFPNEHMGACDMCRWKAVREGFRDD